MSLNMSINKKKPILIIGGGMVGMMMALCLEKIGHKVIILEASTIPNLTEKKYDGRNTALGLASIKLFQSLGLLDQIHQYTQPIEDIIVSDGTVRKGASSSFLHFSDPSETQKPLGYFIENPDLREVLIKAIDQKKETINIHYEQKISHIDYHKNNIIIHTKEENFTGVLAISADGRASMMRLLSDIQVTKKDYGQKGIVTTIHHEMPHKAIAQEYFLPSGPFAMLPLRGNRTSLVWTEPTHIADALTKQSDAVIDFEIKRRFGLALGEFTRQGNILTYPLMRQNACKLYGDRMALIGDAAHIIHPIAGQGFNLSLRGVGVLCDLIENYTDNGLDIGSENLLKEYDDKRQADIFILKTATDRLDAFFSNDHKLLRLIRRTGLSIVNNMPHLKKFFIEHATSKMGDLPKFMR